MKALFLARLATLFLLLTLVLPGTSATAGALRPMRGGHRQLHRPNYKTYNPNHTRWFFQR